MNKRDQKILSRKFTGDADRKRTSKQHTQPCADCPWSRESIAGYTGDNPPERWIEMAHSDQYIDCHNTTNQQCAGAAIFRANVFKVPRDPRVLRLKADDNVCFGSDEEFMEHHKI